MAVTIAGNFSQGKKLDATLLLSLPLAGKRAWLSNSRCYWGFEMVCGQRILLGKEEVDPILLVCIPALVRPSEDVKAQHLINCSRSSFELSWPIFHFRGLAGPDQQPFFPHCFHLLACVVLYTGRACQRICPNEQGVLECFAFEHHSIFFSLSFSL